MHQPSIMEIETDEMMKDQQLNQQEGWKNGTEEVSKKTMTSTPTTTAYSAVTKGQYATGMKILNQDITKLASKIGETLGEIIEQDPTSSRLAQNVHTMIIDSPCVGNYVASSSSNDQEIATTDSTRIEVENFPDGSKDRITCLTPSLDRVTTIDKDIIEVEIEPTLEEREVISLQFMPSSTTHDSSFSSGRAGPRSPIGVSEFTGFQRVSPQEPSSSSTKASTSTTRNTNKRTPGFLRALALKSSSRARSRRGSF